MPRRTIQQKITELRKVSGASSQVGWMHDEVCWLLFGLIRFYRPSLVIQTGHLWGKSALVVLEAMKNERLDSDESMGDKDYAEFVKGNSPPKVKGTLISIDPNPNGASVEWLKQRYPTFVFHEGESREWFEHYAPMQNRMGGRVFGIVDGDHTTQGAAADVEALVKLDAGMVLLDDTSWIPRLRAAGEMEGYSTLELPDYNGVTVMVRQ